MSVRVILCAAIVAVTSALTTASVAAPAMTPPNRVGVGFRIFPAAHDEPALLTGRWRIEMPLAQACFFDLGSPDGRVGVVAHQGCAEPWSRAQSWRAGPRLASVHFLDGSGARVWTGLRDADGTYRNRNASGGFTTMARAPG